MELSSWKAYIFDNIPFPFYIIEAPEAKVGQVRALVNGIAADNFIVVCSTGGSSAYLVIKRSRKTDGNNLFIAIKKQEDLERVTGAIRRLNFVSDELTAHSSVSSLFDLLRKGAERYFTNRGLFSTYYLKERLFPDMTKRKRNVRKETETLFSKFEGEISTDTPLNMLKTLGYSVNRVTERSEYEVYNLQLNGKKIEAVAIVVPSKITSLDIKTEQDVAPSYFAVSHLKDYTWAILTNGRFWRLYSSRVSSSSTNYFELDLEGITDETDQRLSYFVSLFSPQSFVPIENDQSTLDLTLEGGGKYSQEIETDLSSKIFDGQLFLDLVRSVLNHSNGASYSKERLDNAKAIALKLLYRLLFILYAESRNLLPVDDSRYKEISLDGIRSRLSAFKEYPDSEDLWVALKKLFRAISLGDPDHNVPEYDGALFLEDPALDSLHIANRFLVESMIALTEREGLGIDYQNLGVRHLGSLYEALLEYGVRQAPEDLVVFEDQIMDAQYAQGLKKKPKGFIEKGELFLSVRGLERKGTGSYYTPDVLVSFLVREGLKPHFASREEQFVNDLKMYESTSDAEEKGRLAEKTTEDLLGLRVVDPAMGSGHFLVAAVDEITEWIIGILKNNPSSPLLHEIREYREEVLDEQSKKGIKIDESLLTDSVILKRIVMKRCIYGVDINYLAVELTKLSLWLDSFTIGTPLTFLDHHIKCGDSTIGLWLNDIKGKLHSKTLESFTGEVNSVGEGLLHDVIRTPDLTLEQVTQSRKAYLEYTKGAEPMRAALDVESAKLLLPSLAEKVTPNLTMIKDFVSDNPDNFADVETGNDWLGPVHEALSLSKEYSVFHWEIEFPDIFQTGGRKGFDVLLANPPWDAVKPDDDEFFSIYAPKFRMLPNKQEKKKTMDSLLKSNQDISEEYSKYKELIERRVSFYKTNYKRRGSGDTNLWKIFLDRTFDLIDAKNGTISIVLPSGIVTDLGGKTLREELFKGSIRHLYEFENAKGIFPAVDRRFKFVLLVTDKFPSRSEKFDAAFYLHREDSILGKSEHEKFVNIPLQLVELCAPDSLSIPEIRGKSELSVFEKLYQNHPILSDENSTNWSVSFVRELDRTNDSNLFRTDGRGWPLFEGKNFHQFIIDFDKPIYSVEPDSGLQRTASHREYFSINSKIHELVRLAFRGVASSTNVRAMIACILPPRSFCPNSSIIVHPNLINLDLDKKSYYTALAYMSAILNSYVFDFLIRTRISMNLNFFYIYQSPVPMYVDTEISQEIIKLAIRLSSLDERFNDFAGAFGIKTNNPTMKERLEMTAKLNALVAILYGLNKEEVEVILNSFTGFEEDDKLSEIEGEIKWTDDLIKKFNGEVRKRVLRYFESYMDSDAK